jgi:hypothetical protein
LLENGFNFWKESRRFSSGKKTYLCHVISVIKYFIFVQSEEDLAYEEEILRNPYSVKHWLRYCEFKKDATPAVINLIYERALKEMPGRYQSSAIFLSY